MAEVVEYRVEKGVKFLEELEKNAIFDEEEVRIIIKKRKELEYRLQRPKKSKEDYLKYIAYEESLLKLIKARRKRIGNFDCYKEIENDIGLKIKSLYRKVVYRYQSDPKLWFSFINFCKKMKYTLTIGSLYARMLQCHSEKESVWLSAAKWNFEENDTPGVARKLLLRGIRHHPKSSLLWHEYFRMELMCASWMKKKAAEDEEANKGRKRKLNEDDENDEDETLSKPANDAVLSCKLALAVFDNAVKSVPDIQFIVGMIRILDEFEVELRLPVKNHVYNVLKQKFADKEEAWDALARSYFDKAYLKQSVQEIEGSSLKDLKVSKAKEIFEEAVQQLNTEKMWTLYIKFQLELVAKSSGPTRNKRLSDTQSVMERADQSNKMTLGMFIELVLLVSQSASSSKLREMVNMGLEKWSNSPTVWYVSLCVLSEKDHTLKQEIKLLFEKAIRRLSSVPEIPSEENEILSVSPKSIVDVLHLYVKWASASLTSNEVLSIIEKAVGEKANPNAPYHKEISNTLRPLLLEKSMEFKDKGIEKARSYYERYKLTYPVSAVFIRKMLDIELNESRKDDKRIRQVFQDYVNHFGESDHQIWLDLINYELSQKKLNNVSKVYNRACKTLTAEECDRFMCAYSLLNNPNVHEASYHSD